MKRSIKIALIILVVLVIDQVLKIWIKTNLAYGEEIRLLGLNWALIHFVENEGMAFGITLGGEHGKLALSLFRIAAVGFLFYYLRLLLNAKVAFGLIACFALILAGAVGNIIDSAFYGLIFSETPYHSGGVATMFPEGGGYAGFLHGKVVDMFYFPMFEGFFPDWLPIWGGEHYLFFRPVFNVADASITVGVVSLLLFYRSFFSSTQADELAAGESTSAASGDVKVNQVSTEGLEPGESGSGKSSV